MASKHDDDNRSNQLNPNNDAYHSSRGYGSGRNTDDEDYAYAYSSRSYSNTRFVPQAPLVIQEKFHLNFVTFCGQVFLYELTAELNSHHLSGTYGGGDCTDVAEYVFHERSQIIRNEPEVQIASAALSKVGKGPIGWVGGRYKPGLVHGYGGKPTEENVALWLKKGAEAWQELETKLVSGLALDRTDLGVVNGKNLKYFKYRGGP